MVTSEQWLCTVFPSGFYLAHDILWKDKPFFFGAEVQTFGISP